MARPEKVQVIESIRKHFENAKSVFVTEYTGLNVEEITELRKNLRENSVAYLVAKNTLMRIAAGESGNDNLIEYLKGQTALAFGADDPAIAAKILYDSFKKIEKPVIRAFVLDGKLFPGEEITRLADLPSREQLLAQIILGVESPITSIVCSVDALFQELMATLDALRETKQ